MKRVAFRVDASRDIGNGHVMRSLTLAEELRASGSKCVFASRRCSGHLADLIVSRGFDARSMPATSPRTEDGDARETIEALGSEMFDWLVLDHYALGASWEARLTGSTQRIMVIDDLADRPHCCDLLLDQNLGRSAGDYASLLPPTCEVLVGPSHALLRAGFHEWRERSLARRALPVLRHIVVSLGGADRDNVTVRVLEGLRLRGFDGQVTIVLGPASSWIEAVRSAASRLANGRVLVGVDDMAALFASADLAIGAGGTTAWERCCLGVPAIQIVIAPNQLPGSLALEAEGAALVITDATQVGSVLPELLDQVSCTDVLATMSRAAAGVTDGRGPGRVAERMRARSRA